MTKAYCEKSFFLCSIILILISIIISCKKDIGPQDAVADNNSFSERISLNPLYRGLYVDNFDAILGDTSQENSLLRWCKKNKIKTTSLYNAIRGLGTQFNQTHA